MAIEIRPISDGEQEAFTRSVCIPFLEPSDQASLDHWTPHLELGRTWAAEDRGRFVGNCCIFSRDVTVPGPEGGPCPVVPFAAVSGVGVHPTHRRRGLLRRMMDVMLDDARARGEAFAGLLASESHIYGRFGFGMATTMAQVEIDVTQSAFRPDLEPAPVELELMESAEAAKVVPALHDRLRRQRAGDVSRDEATWSGTFADPVSGRGGMGALLYAVAPDGYLAYRGKERMSSANVRGRLLIRDLYGATPQIEAALWRFALDVDLIDEVVAWRRPVDDPVRHRLAQPRAMRTTMLGDFFWVRVLDTPATLRARHYHQPGRIVLDVVAAGGTPDPACGRWVLDAGPDGATCAPAGPGDGTDLRLGLTELGALSLGGTTATGLAHAGRIDEERPGRLAVADRVFTTVPGPQSSTGF